MEKHTALAAEHGDRWPTEGDWVKHSRKSVATRTMLDAITWSGLVENVLQMLKENGRANAHQTLTLGISGSVFMRFLL